MPSDPIADARRLAASKPYTEFEVTRGAQRLRGRDFGGEGETFVLLHGFPDNLHIYDQLAPILAEHGRVVSFDFLGFGASDKPEGYPYDFVQQQGDLRAVMDGLKIEKAIIVAHDAGGVAAINFALDRPDRVAGLGLINIFYAETTKLVLPELIELFAHAPVRRIGMAALQAPDKLEWLLSVQRDGFGKGLDENGRALMAGILQPLVAANFAQQPSAVPAFARMTSQAHEVARANALRLPELRGLSMPVKIVWGARDPYLGIDVAKEIGDRFQRIEYHFVDAGHWPQIERPTEVALRLVTS